jgi:D-alanyl-D-alanine carboxypeptidase
MKSDNLLKLLFLLALSIGIFFGNSNYNNSLNKNDNLVLNSSYIKASANESSKNLSLKENNYKKTEPYLISNVDNLASSTVNNLNNNLLNQGVLVSQENGFIFKYKNLDFKEPEINSEIALIGDLKSGKIIWSKNENKKWPIASLTKLITADYVLENFDKNLKITLTENDVNVPRSVSLEDQNLKAGEIYYLKDLVVWMLLSSNNQAPTALANYFGADNFIRELNNLIKKYDVKNTFLSDSTGLSVSNQSTAFDLFKITKFIFENNPEIFNLTTKKNLTVTELSTNKRKTIISIHPFAGENNFLGGKTGEIPLSRQNLISIFNIEKRPVLMLVLGSEDRALDTQKLFSWFKSNFELIQRK